MADFKPKEKVKIVNCSELLNGLIVDVVGMSQIDPLYISYIVMITSDNVSYKINNGWPCFSIPGDYLSKTEQ
jgi:hypothetical protein